MDSKDTHNAENAENMLLKFFLTLLDEERDRKILRIVAKRLSNDQTVANLLTISDSPDSLDDKI